MVMRIWYGVEEIRVRRRGGGGLSRLGGLKSRGIVGVLGSPDPPEEGG